MIEAFNKFAEEMNKAVFSIMYGDEPVKTTIVTRQNLARRRAETEEKIKLFFISLFFFFIIFASVYLWVTYG